MLNNRNDNNPPLYNFKHTIMHLCCEKLEMYNGQDCSLSNVTPS